MVKAAAGRGLPMQRLDLLKPARSVLVLPGSPRLPPDQEVQNRPADAPPKATVSNVHVRLAQPRNEVPQPRKEVPPLEEDGLLTECAENGTTPSAALFLSPAEHPVPPERKQGDFREGSCPDGTAQTASPTSLVLENGVLLTRRWIAATVECRRPRLGAYQGG